MGPEQTEAGQDPQAAPQEAPAPPDRVIESQLEWMAWAMAVHMAENYRIVASVDGLIGALRAAGVAEFLVPPPPTAPIQLPPRRYSVRANPSIADGAMETLSFRIPSSIKRIFEERVAELAENEDEPGMTNATDAGQDAITRWCLMEGK